jgi:hypothetical protein
LVVVVVVEATGHPRCVAQAQKRQVQCAFVGDDRTLRVHVPGGLPGACTSNQHWYW